jgi:hypothetical protein
MVTHTQRERIHKEFLQKAYAVQDGFLTEAQIGQFLQMITQFRASHTLPTIHRAVQGRALRYTVIDGKNIEQHLPEIAQLYRDVSAFVQEVSDKQMTMLENTTIGVNINIMLGGDSYRWHYERNAVTVVLYLNRVEGGALELYPNYRILLPRNAPSFLQKWLDRFLQIFLVRSLFSRKQSIAPFPGRMLLMYGRTCLHSVSPVTGEQERVSLVLSYDVPHASFLENSKLDTYLYTRESISSDPNYA